MPSDQFPQRQELSIQDLEKIILVKIGPSDSLSDLIQSINNGKWIRFIVTPDFDLILTDYPHSSLVAKLDVERRGCLIPDGAFIFDRMQNKINFELTSEPMPMASTIKKVAEEKIKEFLRSKGISIDKTGYLDAY